MNSVLKKDKASEGKWVTRPLQCGRAQEEDGAAMKAGWKKTVNVHRFLKAKGRRVIRFGIMGASDTGSRCPGSSLYRPPLWVCQRMGWGWGGQSRKQSPCPRALEGSGAGSCSGHEGMFFRWLSDTPHLLYLSSLDGLSGGFLPCLS